MSKPVYFIDDDECERQSCADVLNEIFDDTTISIEPMIPLPNLNDYSALIADDKISALILDERLDTAGSVTYTGAKLAAHLRSIGGKLPIVVLTNFPDDDFTAQGWAVEAIVEKRCVVNDPNSSSAQDFKARLSRQIEIAGTLRAEQERRYHDLLVDSADGKLSSDEKDELMAMEAERIAPISAAERTRLHSLDREIEALKNLLSDEELF